MDWLIAEYEEKLGQAAKLIEMVYADPDNALLWQKLLAWKEEHKTFISSSYEIPEAKGFDISMLDGDEKKLNF